MIKTFFASFLTLVFITGISELKASDDVANNIMSNLDRAEKYIKEKNPTRALSTLKFTQNNFGGDPSFAIFEDRYADLKNQAVDLDKQANADPMQVVLFHYFVVSVKNPGKYQELANKSVARHIALNIDFSKPVLEAVEEAIKEFRKNPNNKIDQNPKIQKNDTISVNWVSFESCGGDFPGLWRHATLGNKTFFDFNNGKKSSGTSCSSVYGSITIN